MITLVTATPRSGKTLWCVEELMKFVTAKDLRPLYSDIEGFTCNAVQHSPDDWRDVPDNAVIFYDECQFRDIYNQKYKGNSDIILDLTIHGHRGIDIYFITQGTRYMNSDVFPLVGQHIHIHNGFNSNRASKIYKFRTVQTNLSKNNLRDAEDVLTWRYPEHLFDVYKSASVHNKKRAWPKKLINVITTIVVVFILAIYYIYQLVKPDNQFTNPTETVIQTQSVKSSTPANQQSTSQSTVTTSSEPHDIESKRIAMISKSDTYCRAYDGNGDVMRYLSYNDCLFYSDNPIALKSSAVPKTTMQQTTESTSQASDPVLTIQPAI